MKKAFEDPKDKHPSFGDLFTDTLAVMGICAISAFLIFSVLVPASVKGVTREIEAYHTRAHAADPFNFTAWEDNAKQIYLSYTIQTELNMQWIRSTAKDCGKALNFNPGTPFASWCESSFGIGHNKAGYATQVKLSLHHLNTVERWCTDAFPDMAKQAYHDYPSYRSAAWRVENYEIAAQGGFLYNISKDFAWTTELTPIGLKEADAMHDEIMRGHQNGEAHKEEAGCDDMEEEP